MRLWEKILQTGETVFVNTAQSRTASRENGFVYDELASGSVVYAYSPYGEGQTLGPDNNNPIQYTGRENDNTGLYYYRARYYDPVQKRFVSEDPIGLAGGINQYSYVNGNPVSFTDPQGLFVWGDPINQDVVDVVTGFGDAFLIPELVRDALDIDGGVNKCSTAYQGGKVAGFITGGIPFALRGAAAAGATRAGHVLNHNRYLRIGPGRMSGGTHVPRMSIGKGPGNPHMNLSRGAYAPPIGGINCGCE